MRRGGVVVAQTVDSLAPKARPCVVISRDSAIAQASKLTLCPLTSRLKGARGGRPFVAPNGRNGLLHPSEVQVDWVFTLNVDRIGKLVGYLDDEVLDQVDDALRNWLEL